jgi:hypothetical protein
MNTCTFVIFDRLRRMAVSGGSGHGCAAAHWYGRILLNSTLSGGRGVTTIETLTKSDPAFLSVESKDEDVAIPRESTNRMVAERQTISEQIPLK